MVNNIKYIDTQCIQCNKVFKKQKHLYTYNIKHNRKVFCSKQCGYNHRSKKETVQCANCYKNFILPKGSKPTKSGDRYCSLTCSKIATGIKNTKERFCKYCETILNPNKEKTFKKVCTQCKNQKTRTVYKASKMLSLTKGQLFTKRRNWQSARSTIRKLACQIFSFSSKPKECAVCGYKLHIEICHIKAVKDFSNDAALSEINNIKNLVALCRNHHWEQENNILNLNALAGAAPTLSSAYETE